MVPAPFRYPFRGERAVDTLLIGGGLHLLAVYLPVVPLVFVVGYLLVVLETTATAARGERFDTLPPFRKVRSLARTGLGGSAIVLAYVLPATLTLLVTIVGITGRAFDPTSMDIGTALGFVAGTTASLFLGVTFVYLLPAALVNFVRTDRLRAAADFGFLRRAAADGEYFYNVVTGIVLGGLILSIGGALASVAVGFFIAFYGEVVMVAYWGGGVGRLLDED